MTPRGQPRNLSKATLVSGSAGTVVGSAQFHSPRRAAAPALSVGSYTAPPSLAVNDMGVGGSSLG